ncbi:hypothetical protein CPLU01_12291 [Colletotrichum plurivorum]|uniref:Uncharacterized protein n=1 Tax=Colletotrichum plurivorum TaxID=2175906 RepID=A0A8H6N700_9PEZI|nr:hypothetical protein CPLU01_12291 [Colletotrichum plurivorum]
MKKTKLALPYEVFLHIIEEAACNAKLAFEPMELKVDFYAESNPRLLIDTRNFPHWRDLDCTSVHSRRYSLVHNILHIDKRSRAIALAITSLHPLTVTFHGPDPRISPSFRRTAYICPDLDSFRVVTIPPSILDHALNHPTSTTAAIINCMRFVRAHNQIDIGSPETAKTIASLPNLEGFIIDLRLHMDIMTIASAQPHRYREICMSGERGRMSQKLLAFLCLWKSQCELTRDFEPSWELLRRRNIQIFVENWHKVDVFDATFLQPLFNETYVDVIFDAFSLPVLS